MTIVNGYGPKDAKIALVGECPAKYEARFGIPFSGPAGKNLDECLRNAHVIRAECYLTNVFKETDLPLSAFVTERAGRYKTYVPTPLGENALGSLARELGEIGAHIIVPMGNVALWALCARFGIMNWRGSILESELLPGRKCLPTIHPAFWTEEKLFKSPQNFLARYLVTMDLERALKESAYPDIRKTDRHLVIEPNYYDAMAFLKKCADRGAMGATIYYDIEITPGTQKLSCISFSIGHTDCMSIPFVGPQGNFYDLEQEYNIICLIADIMSDPRIKKGGQNLVFDSHFLLREYGIETSEKDDTMVAQGILYPEFRNGKRLNFITAMWSDDIPYYKADGKFWITGEGDWRKGWTYNGFDSIACGDAFPKQMQELESRGNQETYQRVVRLIEPLTYMMEHGIKVDVDGMKRAKQECYEQEGLVVQKLYSEIGREINFNSPKQLKEYFYGECGLDPIKNNDQKVTVNEDALRAIAKKGYPEAELILEARRLHKRQSTFLDLTKVDSDGRMRCSYNPVGTKFGRISSSENIFGTGTNLQNNPHEVLTFFVADPGYIIYSLDMSQIENRLVAYIGNIIQMIDAFERGIDLHRLTASLVFGVDYDKVTTWKNSCPIGDGTKSQRHWGKTCNHAFNYGFGYKSFAMKYEVKEYHAKQLHREYHRKYPGVEHGYWAYVQDELKRDRTLTNLMGRRITFLGRWNESSFLHEAYSAIPQGTCGDLVNENGINFTYYNTAPHFRPVELLAQIHDEVVIQIPLSVPLIEHARVLLDMKVSLEMPLRFKNKRFHIPADIGINFNMNKDLCYEIKSHNVPKTPEELASVIQHAINIYSQCLHCEQSRFLHSEGVCTDCKEELVAA